VNGDGLNCDDRDAVVHKTDSGPRFKTNIVEHTLLKLEIED
jgi:hypothetical protein